MTHLRINLQTISVNFGPAGLVLLRMEFNKSVSAQLYSQPTYKSTEQKNLRRPCTGL